MSSSPPCSSAPLTQARLEERLDEVLDAALSTRRTSEAMARGLAALPRPSQDFALHWIEVIAASNSEMACQFATRAPRALELLGQDGVRDWLLGVMDVFDRQGLYAASALLRQVEAHASDIHDARNGVLLKDAAPVLELFLCGLAGRRLRIEPGEAPLTDTGAVFLPARVALFPDRERNALLYKAMAAQLWAQARWGSYALPPERYPAEPGALERLARLEAMRLSARIARLLPGLARDTSALEPAPTGPAAQAARRLAQPGSTVEDSLRLLDELPEDAPLPRWPHAGLLDPARAAAVRAARLERERSGLKASLARLLDEARRHAPGLPVRFSAAVPPQAERDQGRRVELLLDGRPVDPPAEVRAMLDSIAQDLGGIPPEYLVPAGDGWQALQDEARDPAADVWKGPYHEEGAFLYDEWDHARGSYRKGWCVLREMDVHPGDPAFVARTLARYGPQLHALRKSFEWLRGEDRMLRREPHGEDVDLDAVVEAHADLRQGMELGERLFARRHKAERDLAVMLMVDMSGSTKGWINDAEREALVLLAESLEVLGDRYAIYGFSGITRKRCEVYRVKRFDEPYGDAVKARIAGIIPLDYTRLGAAVRHLTRLLDQVEARTKLLITLSDGRPDDYYDNYRGEYGIQDTRHALLEARRRGIHPFCITLDREARDYLPRMYGEVNYTVVADVAALPVKVAAVYRRLTR